MKTEQNVTVESDSDRLVEMVKRYVNVRQGIALEQMRVDLLELTKEAIPDFAGEWSDVPPCVAAELRKHIRRPDEEKPKIHSCSRCKWVHVTAAKLNDFMGTRKIWHKRTRSNHYHAQSMCYWCRRGDELGARGWVLTGGEVIIRKDGRHRTQT